MPKNRYQQPQTSSCQYCGEQFQTRGLNMHERSCSSRSVDLFMPSSRPNCDTKILLTIIQGLFTQILKVFEAILTFDIQKVLNAVSQLTTFLVKSGLQIVQLIVCFLSSPQRIFYYVLWYQLFVVIVCPFLVGWPLIEPFFVCEILQIPMEAVSQIATIGAIQFKGMVSEMIWLKDDNIQLMGAYEFLPREKPFFLPKTCQSTGWFCDTAAQNPYLILQAADVKCNELQAQGGKGGENEMTLLSKNAVSPVFESYVKAWTVMGVMQFGTELHPSFIDRNKEVNSVYSSYKRLKQSQSMIDKTALDNLLIVFGGYWMSERHEWPARLTKWRCHTRGDKLGWSALDMYMRETKYFALANGLKRGSQQCRIKDFRTYYRAWGMQTRAFKLIPPQIRLLADYLPAWPASQPDDSEVTSGNKDSTSFWYQKSGAQQCFSDAEHHYHFSVSQQGLTNIDWGFDKSNTEGLVNGMQHFNAAKKDGEPVNL